jgi:3' terminal RNA ribose 2'-O-methyltransferase Hen1
MLLTITTTHQPATDLGYLLYKNPARPQSFELSFGRAPVFYPDARDESCTAALLLEVDPVGLVRNRRGPAGEGFSLEQYVNDRPYVASSLLSVAIAQVYGSALSGSSRERPELAKTPIPLLARLSVLPCRGGERFLRSLFEPLGYRVAATHHALDEHFPDWGESPYFTVELSHPAITLHDLLAHLYVLIPVLDNDKHYWIGEDEVQKLPSDTANRGWRRIRRSRRSSTATSSTANTSRKQRWSSCSRKTSARSTRRKNRTCSRRSRSRKRSASTSIASAASLPCYGVAARSACSISVAATATC